MPKHTDHVERLLEQRGPEVPETLDCYAAQVHLLRG
jgi:hypothetical protein